jgi:hypothetical protein
MAGHRGKLETRKRRCTAILYSYQSHRVTLINVGIFPVASCSYSMSIALEENNRLVRIHTYYLEVPCGLPCLHNMLLSVDGI